MFVSCFQTKLKTDFIFWSPICKIVVFWVSFPSRQAINTDRPYQPKASVSDGLEMRLNNQVFKELHLLACPWLFLNLIYVLINPHRDDEVSPNLGKATAVGLSHRNTDLFSNCDF